MTPFELFLQQLLTGISNGMIVALIALGYTMVYGVLELINFAHGDLFMLGAFMALTIVGIVLPSEALTTTDLGGWQVLMIVILLMTICAIFCGAINVLIYLLAYRPLTGNSRLAPLVSALGASFVLLNIGLFWGGLPLEVFSFGSAAAAPKDFPNLLPADNLLGDSTFYFTAKDILVYGVTALLLVLLLLIVKYTFLGKAMRAIAQDPVAARLMGVDADRIVCATFFIGGAFAGVASVIYALYNNTVFFQMGFRVGIDAFIAAVLGGIGNPVGAVLGGLLIGISRALSDQYIATHWTNVVVFSALIIALIFRPAGLLKRVVPEKV